MQTDKDYSKLAEICRESYLGDSLPSESSDGWAAVSGKLRRRSIVRRSALMLGIFLPLMAGTLFGLRFFDAEDGRGDIFVAERSEPSQIEVVTPAADELPETSALAYAEPVKSFSSIDTQEFMPDDAYTQEDETEPFPRSSVEQEETSGRTEEKDVSSRPVRTNTSETVHRHVDLRVQTLRQSRRPFALSASVQGLPTSSGRNDVTVSPMLSAVPFTSDVKTFKASFDEIYTNSDFYHFMPLGVSLTASCDLGHNLALSSGLSYTMLSSKVQPRGSGDFARQYVHYVGIPLTLDWNFFRRNGWGIYSRIGGRMDVCAGARYDGKRIDEKPLQWTLNASVGVNYDFNSTVGIFLQPELDWYLTETRLNTIRSKSPVNATLRLGLRFNLN